MRRFECKEVRYKLCYSLFTNKFLKLSSSHLTSMVSKLATLRNQYFIVSINYYY